MKNIIKSMEHSESRRILEEQESRDGFVEKYTIYLKTEGTNVGFTPTPSHPVNAFKVTVDNVTGFLFHNDDDNYYRADFFGEEYLASAPEFLSKETPMADRVAQEARKKELLEQKMVAAASRAEAFNEWHREQKIVTLKANYADRKKINELIGLVYVLPDTEDEFVREGALDLTKTYRSASGILDSIKKMEDEFHSKPVFLLNKDSSEKERVNSVIEQIKEQSFKLKNGFTVEYKEENNMATVSVLGSQNQLLSKLIAPITTEEATVTFCDKENFDFEEKLTVSFVNIYHDKVTVAEKGRVIDPSDSVFYQLYDEITAQNFAEQWEDLPSLEFATLNDQALICEKERNASWITSVILTNNDLCQSITNAAQEIEKAPKKEINTETTYTL